VTSQAIPVELGRTRIARALSPDEIATLRAAVVAEARSWIGTPYRAGNAVKGAGCDCASLIAAVMFACGVFEPEEIGFHGAHWWANGGEEKYMFRLRRHARKMVEGIAYATLEARPGDIALVRVAGSELYNHGGIVTKWPRVVHNVGPSAVEVNASNDCCGTWANQQVAIFDPFKKFEQ
jgi:NlpC/P60 family putative phage cell wall peptidase